MIPNQKTLFINAEIIGSQPMIACGWLLTEGKRILSFGEGEPPILEEKIDLQRIDCTTRTLLPGFIDLHTHGALGSDFIDGSPEDIQKISTFYASHGVTGFLASTYTATKKEIEYALQTIRSCIGKEKGALILGIHLEGPWLNAACAGAQDTSLIRVADPSEVLPYLDSGLIKLIALAPEIQENRWLINECQTRGITAAAGHTDATYEEMEDALRMGVTLVTHCFNAMSPLHHRQPGVVGAALTLPELRCELIADNIHVHPAVMRLLVNTKTPQGVILVTDSISVAGMPDGSYSLKGRQVICSGGAARLLDGTLAGSSLTMETALANLMSAAQRPLVELWRCSSFNAAKSIHISDHKGKIEPGFDADLVLLDSNLHVVVTMVEGIIVFVKR
ncbi:MAG: N-acetylglucosamine-6-phosphate deacetylase [Chloroflexi bacterium]|nr:MAG: N-acetylglucosamine-6-phosphate deacetylase [Chloroflexota bacterium]